jgi:hypothetical protein
MQACHDVQKKRAPFCVLKGARFLVFILGDKACLVSTTILSSALFFQRGMLSFLVITEQLSGALTQGNGSWIPGSRYVIIVGSEGVMAQHSAAPDKQYESRIVIQRGVLKSHRALG